MADFVHLEAGVMARTVAIGNGEVKDNIKVMIG